jgi:hypothetical protein
MLKKFLISIGYRLSNITPSLSSTYIFIICASGLKFWKSILKIIRCNVSFSLVITLTVLRVKFMNSLSLLCF